MAFLLLAFSLLVVSVLFVREVVVVPALESTVVGGCWSAVGDGVFVVDVARPGWCVASGVGAVAIAVDDCTGHTGRERSGLGADVEWLRAWPGDDPGDTGIAAQPAGRLGGEVVTVFESAGPVGSLFEGVDVDDHGHVRTSSTDHCGVLNMFDEEFGYRDESFGASFRIRDVGREAELFDGHVDRDLDEVEPERVEFRSDDAAAASVTDPDTVLDHWFGLSVFAPKCPEMLRPGRVVLSRFRWRPQ